MIVRPVRTDEHARVGRILVEAYGPSGMAPDSSYWADLSNTAARTGDAEVWVAELAGRVVGTVTWAPRGSGQRDVARDDEAEFRMLAVEPAARGRGVGAALVAAVVERAREEGFAAVVMSSSTWMTTAHRLYARAGFRRLPERDWWPDPDVFLWAFRLPL